MFRALKEAISSVEGRVFLATELERKGYELIRPGVFTVRQKAFA